MKEERLFFNVDFFKECFLSQLNLKLLWGYYLLLVEYASIRIRHNGVIKKENKDYTRIPHFIFDILAWFYFKGNFNFLFLTAV